jgi:hypothetical protein
VAILAESQPTSEASWIGGPSSNRTRALGLAMLEVLLIVSFCYSLAASPPPGVGESHYLAKAKHYWNPAWCEGDLFLESADAHQIFYWTFGWVTRFASLSTTAWIGRFVTWGLLAWSWQRLSTAIVPRAFVSVISAGLMLALLRWFHMAGEWIVGGVEAKGFAYVFVLLALEAVVRQRWNRAWLCVGAASAFHVLVGGWTGIALGFAWLAAGSDRYPLVKMWPAVLGGALISLAGVIPALALTRGFDPQIVAEANRIYVFERLGHHLVFHRFQHVYMARQAVLLLAWMALAWQLRANLALRRLNLVVAGAVVIAACGILIDQVLLAGFYNVDLTAKLLRYYWFRLSDALLPIGVALSLVVWARLWVIRRPAVARLTYGALLLAALLNIAAACYERGQQYDLPGGFEQAHPLLSATGEPVIPAADRANQFEHWRDVTRWIAANTPSAARFLTPRRQQTFKWYAGRSEVVTWKDVPQDAAVIVAWHDTLHEIFPRERGIRDLSDHTDADLLALARKHHADYILLDCTLGCPPRSLPKVYPVDGEANPAYEVYRVPDESDWES